MKHYANILEVAEDLCGPYGIDAHDVRRILITRDTIEIEHYKLNANGNKYLVGDRPAIETLIMPIEPA